MITNPSSFRLQIGRGILLDPCHLLHGAALALQADGLGAALAIGADALRLGLGLGDFLLSSGHGGGGRGEALFRIREIGKDRGAAALQDAAKEAAQEIHQTGDHDRQVDDVGVEHVGVQTEARPV